MSNHEYCEDCGRSTFHLLPGETCPTPGYHDLITKARQNVERFEEQRLLEVCQELNQLPAIHQGKLRLTWTDLQNLLRAITVQITHGRGLQPLLQDNIDLTLAKQHVALLEKEHQLRLQT